MEFVIDGSFMKRLNQVPPNILRELAAVDKNVSAGHVAVSNNIRRENANLNWAKRRVRCERTEMRVARVQFRF